MKFKDLLYENDDKIRKLVSDTIYELCSYDESGMNGPIGAGTLLHKYGKKCDYSIRDYYVDYEVSGNNILIKYVTQETPIKPAITMIKEALKTIADELKGYTVKIEVHDRDNEEQAKGTIKF